MEQKEEYLEKTNHGSPLFPIEYYHCLYPAGLSALPAHWHEEFEITYIRKGRCTYLVDLEACHAVESSGLAEVFEKLKKSFLGKGEGYELESEALLYQFFYLLYKCVPHKRITL